MERSNIFFIFSHDPKRVHWLTDNFGKKIEIFNPFFFVYELGLLIFKRKPIHLFLHIPIK